MPGAFANSDSHALNIENPTDLRQYLVAANLLAADEPVSIVVLPGGVSSRTVLVERQSGPSWVFKQSLAKLRVAVDWFSDPTRIHREALGLRWMARLAPAGSVPALIFEDSLEHVLGMEAVPEPHQNWKSMLLAGRAPGRSCEPIRPLAGHGASPILAATGRSWRRCSTIGVLPFPTNRALLPVHRDQGARCGAVPRRSS